MKRFRKSALIFMLIACLGMLLVSCNSQETNTTSSDENENVTKDKPKEEAKDSDEKVTLEVMVAWDENMFNDRFKNPVEKKFPNITLKQVPGNNWDRADMEKQFSKGVSPDFFFTLGVDTIEYFNLEMDLDPFIKASNFDTSSINPVLFDQIRSADPEGRLLSWPYEYTYYAMLYNTDIFDLFGVPYPEDGMTWAETIELAKQLTGTRNGVDYRGLDIPGGIPIDQFSVTKTDPETGEVLILKEMNLRDS